MLSIDMDHAVSRANFDNFSVLLFRLMLEADGDNMARFAKGFPIEVKMVEIYRNRCPYKAELAADGFRIPDFDKIKAMATKEVG